MRLYMLNSQGRTYVFALIWQEHFLGRTHGCAPTDKKIHLMRRSRDGRCIRYVNLTLVKKETVIPAL